LENKIFSVDPFVSIDDGVSDLIEIAVEKGRKQNKNLKLGILRRAWWRPKKYSILL
jgi:pyruvate,orthophosphate dikinase